MITVKNKIEIRKKIVTDEAMHPIAIQIDYEDWLEIERLLKVEEKKTEPLVLSRYSGVISLKEDPLDFQLKIRGEWR